MYSREEKERYRKRGRMHYGELMKSEGFRKEAVPQKGQMMAYLPEEKVCFQPYQDLKEVEQYLADKELLELHLFDEECEYRAIASRSPRFPDGFVETVTAFSDREESEVYKDVIALDSMYGTSITVLNHISYEKTGMAMIDDYRLKMGRK